MNLIDSWSRTLTAAKSSVNSFNAQHIADHGLPMTGIAKAQTLRSVAAARFATTLADGYQLDRPYTELGRIVVVSPDGHKYQLKSEAGISLEVNESQQQALISARSDLTLVIYAFDSHDHLRLSAAQAIAIKQRGQKTRFRLLEPPKRWGRWSVDSDAGPGMEAGKFGSDSTADFTDIFGDDIDDMTESDDK